MKLHSLPNKKLPTYFVRETEYVQTKLWIEGVMLIDVLETTASVIIIKTPSRGHPSKDGGMYEDST